MREKIIIKNKTLNMQERQFQLKNQAHQQGATAMSDPNKQCTSHRSPNAVYKVTITLSAIGLSLWWWLKQHHGTLPLPNTRSGKALLRQYQGTMHDIWLILLLISLGYLIKRIYISKRSEHLETESKQKQPVELILIFLKNNPIVTIFFAIYTVAMISGTTYLYKDMVGWYPELVNGHFLNNFSIRGSFISETMRRSDYRFFPLAHQDLHILSWFTIHIKTWMIFNAAQLVGVVLLSNRFLEKLESKKTLSQSTILLMTCLLLIHPSTGTAFFHVIYSERLLCLIFTLYITSYLHYRSTGNSSSFYLTFLWALTGMYIKDIGILLFVIPAASLWIADSINTQSNVKRGRLQGRFQQSNLLEQWICSLTAVFIMNYIFLALIPSSYAMDGAYNEDATYANLLDFRFYIFSSIAVYRGVLILRRRKSFDFLDAINLSAIAYAIALGITYKFNSNSYLSLPFQLITTINMGWAWIVMSKKMQCGENIKLAAAVLTSSLVVGIDHATSADTFASEISQQKFEQTYIQTTYEKLDKVSREMREEGDDVNIIINRKSRLSASRHLNRIPYKSLVEYEPKLDEFIVKDGAGKNSVYKPKVGDLVANLDKKTDLLDPILDKVDTELIYRHNPGTRTGLILRITGIKN